MGICPTRDGSWKECAPGMGSTDAAAKFRCDRPPRCASGLRCRITSSLLRALAATLAACRPVWLPPWPPAALPGCHPDRLPRIPGAQHGRRFGPHWPRRPGHAVRCAAGREAAQHWMRSKVPLCAAADLGERRDQHSCSCLHYFLEPHCGRGHLGVRWCYRVCVLSTAVRVSSCRVESWPWR